VVPVLVLTDVHQYLVYVFDTDLARDEVLPGRLPEVKGTQTLVTDVQPGDSVTEPCGATQISPVSHGHGSEIV
jgi:hypothetical protein